MFNLNKLMYVTSCRWGILDVEDVLAGADYLTKQNLVDPKKICIAGGSAGGFTSLNALIAEGSPIAAGEW